MGYKVWVKAKGEKDFATNGLVFPTEESATTWGSDLLLRWTMAAEFKVLPSEELVNMTEAGEHIRVEAGHGT